jgi:sec-independent protein translocase protein TatA
MLQNLTGWHALIILAVVLLLFGAAKLPALAKSVGQSVRILKDEVVEPDDNKRPVQAASTLPAAAPAAERASVTVAEHNVTADKQLEQSAS